MELLLKMLEERVETVKEDNEVLINIFLNKIEPMELILYAELVDNGKIPNPWGSLIIK